MAAGITLAATAATHNQTIAIIGLIIAGALLRAWSLTKRNQP